MVLLWTITKILRGGISSTVTKQYLKKKLWRRLYNVRDRKCQMFLLKNTSNIFLQEHFPVTAVNKPVKQLSHQLMN